MEFEVYCDESAIEALTNNDEHAYTGIGSIWMPKTYREKFKLDIKKIKEKHNYNHEFKWKKVSPSNKDFYLDLIDYFFRSDKLRFRIILIESDKINHEKYNERDPELGFYKFYYQLINHWIFDFNDYFIFTDFKKNRDKSRLNIFKQVLNRANLFSEIKQLQELKSVESLGIQFADFLTGLVTSKFNQHYKPNGTKEKIIHIIEKEHLKKEITHTPKWEEKFNVFKINLQGGW